MYGSNNGQMITLFFCSAPFSKFYIFFVFMCRTKGLNIYVTSKIKKNKNKNQDFFYLFIFFAVCLNLSKKQYKFDTNRQKLMTTP